MESVTEPTPAELKVRQRINVLNRAEDMAWASLTQAVRPDANRDHRIQQAALAANLFTCIAAILGQPTMTAEPEEQPVEVEPEPEQAAD